jgi:hypothetical protein
LSLGDGLGSEFKSLDKASEDFLTIDGKLYKLDVTEMKYSKDDYSKPKSIKTASESEQYKKVFKDRHCEFKFKSVGQVEEGVNAGIIAFKQYLTYGFFYGYCQIDGETITLDRIFGHIEHVFSRW